MGNVTFFVCLKEIKRHIVLKMKRSTVTTPTRPNGFLTQKKIRSFLEPSKEIVKPLNQVKYVEDEVRPIILIAGLRFAMGAAIKYQLDAFKMGQVKPRVCALNKDHIEVDEEEDDYTVVYHIRYFEEMCHAFLKMFSSFRRPCEFSETTGEFLAEDDTFHKAWVIFHQNQAKLRIVCRECQFSQAIQSKSPCNEKKKKQSVTKSINLILAPYKEGSRIYEHPWLDIVTWGERSGKGNYSRKLGDKFFTLFQKNAKWHYVYDNQFGKETYDSIKDILQDTFRLYNDTIKRFI